MPIKKDEDTFKPSAQDELGRRRDALQRVGPQQEATDDGCVTHVAFLQSACEFIVSYSRRNADKSLMQLECRPSRRSLVSLSSSSDELSDDGDSSEDFAILEKSVKRRRYCASLGNDAKSGESLVKEGVSEVDTVEYTFVILMSTLLRL